MKFGVRITIKPEIIDPAGKQTEGRLRSLGFKILAVRQGTYIEIELEGKDPEADVRAMCETLLANPVTETYEVLALEAPASTQSPKKRRKKAATKPAK